MTTQAGLNHFPCEQCGASLTYVPGTEQLDCAHCGHAMQIHEAVTPIIEYDYHQALSQLAHQSHDNSLESIECQSCAATFEFKDGVSAGECPFCGTAIVSEHHARQQIAPESLLPFRIDAKQAQAAYKRWLKKLWFAPNKLKRYAKKDRPLNGIYVPYWTYDSQTTTQYHGQRGTVYHEPQTVRIKVNGRWTTQTRMIAKVRWTPVSGVVQRDFDDVLIYGSNTLPRSIAKELNPWDLDQLKPFQNEYLSGFQSEMYNISLESGFNIAKERMHPRIRQDIAMDIGGDRQRITSSQTHYKDIRFKHILLPFWVAGFRFNNKIYQFIVNGRTGEVQGKRPYSWIKITLAAITATILIGVLGYYFIEHGGLEILLQEGINQLNNFSY